MTSRARKPNYSSPKGAAKSEELVEAALPVDPFEGMRELTAEEEITAIPVPQKEVVQLKKPDWLPDTIDLSHIPEDLRQEYFHTDIRSAVEASPIQSEGLEELMLEIEREQATVAPQVKAPRRRSSFGAPPAEVEQAPVQQMYKQQAPVQQPPVYREPAPQPTYVAQEAPPMAPTYAPARGYVPPAPTGAAQAQPRKPLHHPVFDSLLSDFGLKNDIKSETYKGHKFTFKQYNADQYTFCISLADTLSTSPMEYSERIRQNLVAITIVAIDDCPVYEILGRDPKSMGFLLTDRVRIPTKMSMMLTEAVRELFLEKFTPNVVIDLWAIYDGLFPASQLEGSAIADEETPAWRYKCPVSGCSHSVDTVPEIDQYGAPRRMFCPKHGNELVPVGMVADMGDVPLA